MNPLFVMILHVLKEYYFPDLGAKGSLKSERGSLVCTELSRMLVC